MLHENHPGNSRVSVGMWKVPSLGERKNRRYSVIAKYDIDVDTMWDDFKCVPREVLNGGIFHDILFKSTRIRSH